MTARPTDNHPWRNRGLGIDDGLWHDYVTVTQRKPLWMNLDSAIDGGHLDGLMMRRLKQGLIHAAPPWHPGGPLLPYESLLLAVFGIPVECCKCGQIFQSPIHENYLSRREICNDCARKRVNEWQKKRRALISEQGF